MIYPLFRVSYLISYGARANQRALLRLLLGGMMMLGAMSLHGATMPLILNGVDWGTNYYNPDTRTGAAYDGLPNNASPSWTKGGTAGLTGSLGDGYLRLETTASQALHYRQSTGWDASNAATVEFAMRVESYVSESSPYGAQLLLGNGSGYFTFAIGTTFFSFGGDQSAEIYDFTKMTTFRITLTHMQTTPTATLYINHSPVAAAQTTTFTGSTINYIRFGDASDSAQGLGGVTEWESIRWTTGAYAPIPEPSVAVLGGLGAFLFFGFMARRKRWSWCAQQASVEKLPTFDEDRFETSN